MVLGEKKEFFEMLTNLKNCIIIVYNLITVYTILCIILCQHQQVSMPYASHHGMMRNNNDDNDNDNEFIFI